MLANCPLSRLCLLCLMLPKPSHCLTSRVRNLDPQALSSVVPAHFISLCSLPCSLKSFTLPLSPSLKVACSLSPQGLGTYSALCPLPPLHQVPCNHPQVSARRSYSRTRPPCNFPWSHWGYHFESLINIYVSCKSYLRGGNNMSIFRIHVSLAHRPTV